MAYQAPKDALAQAMDTCRSGFMAAALFSVVINLLVLAVPIYSLQVFDRILSTRSVETLLALSGLTIALLSLQSCLDHIRALIMRRIALRLETGLTGPMLRTALDEAARGNQNAAGGLNDLREVRQALSNPSLCAFFDAIWTPLFLLIVFVIHPALGAFVAVAALILGVLTVANVLAARRPQDRESAAVLILGEQVNDYIRRSEAIQAMGMAGHVVSRWKEQNGRVLALNSRAMGRVGLVFAATKFTRMALQVGITGLGAWLVLDHAITPGSMIASSLLMGRALAPFEQAVGGWKGWSSAFAAFRRIQDSLKRPQLAPSAARFPAPDGMLEVNNVRYCPPGRSDLILRGVSFTLKAGNILVIVGPSGAGKSTLARVIAGAWRPTGGEIRLDGVDLATWERDDLGRHVGYLPQNVQLLSGTVAQNISRFDPDPSFETIIAAAREAGVHDMILRLPQGYETAIGEWGLQLSGGQQQRIGLARAVYGNPRLIILDEPNSNLDPDGEAALVEAIQASRRAGRTIVAISHRASLLRSADWVIVMRDGVIEKAGARDAVMTSLSGSASLHGDGARLPQAAVS